MYCLCFTSLISAQTYFDSFFCAYITKMPYINVSEPASQDLFAVPATFWAALPESEAVVSPAAHLQLRAWPQRESPQNSGCQNSGNKQYCVIAFLIQHSCLLPLKLAIVISENQTWATESSNSASSPLPVSAPWFYPALLHNSRALENSSWMYRSSVLWLALPCIQLLIMLKE